MQMRIGGLVLAACGLGLAGCPDAELAPLEPCTVSGVVREVQQNAVDKVDLLFVVDNSQSMAEEQALLAQQLPNMVQVLASGDRGLDGSQDFPPVTDMHLGVVSTDMGAAGHMITNGQGVVTCEGLGDDGVLLNEVAPDCPGVSVPDSYLTFNQGEDPVALGEAFGCITRLGTLGCPQEQQLEAMLKAVTPSGAGQQITFFGNTVGHGNGANAGFLRENAVLAVIVVTDEEDCSVTEGGADLLAREGGAFSDVPINVRCPEAQSGNLGPPENLLLPVSRYYEGLVALKPLNPELVVFAAITGIPKRFEGEQPGAGNEDAFYQEILDDVQMQYVPEPNATDSFAQPRASCVFGENSEQKAFPPRRIVETARQFGANGTVQTICTNDFTPALDNIIEKISDQLKGACLPRELTRNQQGIVECDIVELVRDTGEGAALCDAAGRTDDGSATIRDSMDNEVVFRRCVIDQVAVQAPGGDVSACTDNPQSCLTSGVDGWYYDNFSQEVLDNCEDAPQRITFTGNAAPRSGSTVRIECLQPVLSIAATDRGREAVGISCEGEGEAFCASKSDDEFTLICEDSTNTCQIECPKGMRVECPNGWECAQNLGICINPTCPAIDF